MLRTGISMRFREGPLFQHRDERRGFSRVFTIGRILAGTALLAWLAGCGKNTITPQPAITPSQSATVGAISVPPPSLFSSNPGGVFNLAGLLHIDTSWPHAPSGSIRCAINYDEDTNIVLATNRLTYDTGEIQQMTAVFAFDQSSLPGEKPPLFPNTLQRVSGDLPGADIPNWNTDDRGYVSDSGGCTGAWSFTNIGQQAIQIALGIRYVRASQPNNYHYRLIDACSLPGVVSPGNCGHKAGGSPTVNTFTFLLKPGSKNTIVQATSRVPPLNPGGTADVELIFLPANSADHQIYSFVPEFTVSTINERITLSLPQLTSTISFITPSQLSCYHWQNNTFVSLDIGNVSYSPPFVNPNSNVLCM